MLKSISYMLKQYITKGIAMNIFKLSLIATSLLLIGCGSDSKSDDTPKVQSITEAVNNTKALNALGNLSKIGGANSSKMHKLSQNQTFPCSGGGTMSINTSEDETESTIVMNKCNQEGSYMDGSLIMIEKDDGYFKMTMKNLTVKESNGDKTSAKQLIMEGNDNEYWSALDGDISIASKCFNATLDIKTLEKMYEMQDGSDGVEKGKIELNGASYTFNYPNVTIKAGSETKTMSQTELDKEMESATTTCKIGA